MNVSRLHHGYHSPLPPSNSKTMDQLSSENLNLIPPPKELKKLCKSISVLEAIISPEWEYRYYSYQKNWSEKEEFCEMRNGQGDQMLILFTEKEDCINGFARASEMNGWKKIAIVEKRSIAQKLFSQKQDPRFKLIQEIRDGVIDELPEIFKEFILGEPVKSIGTTFCIWSNRNIWSRGKIVLPTDEYKDGSSDLLHLLDGNPATYKSWAEEYYEEEFENRELELELVNKIYSGTSLTQEMALKINPLLEDFETLKSDLNEIGYNHQI